MKKYLRILLLLLLSIVADVALAYDAKIGFIYYNFSGNEATVTYGSEGNHKSSYSGTVLIPASVTYNGKTYRVTSIGSDAFYDCSSLTYITIPASVTSIGIAAFSGCTSLTDITIPESVTNIRNAAFSGCTSLASITIPKSVTYIGDATFRGCSGLTSIKVKTGNIEYNSRNNCNAIIKTTTNTLIAGCRNTIIPNSVTCISNFAFSGCTGLTYITIPNSVTSIGGSAFSDCI